MRLVVLLGLLLGTRPLQVDAHKPKRSRNRNRRFRNSHFINLHNIRRSLQQQEEGFDNLYSPQ